MTALDPATTRLSGPRSARNPAASDATSTPAPSTTDTLPDDLQPVPRRTRGHRIRVRSISRILAPLAMLGLILAAWTALSRSLDADRQFLLPSPMAVLNDGIFDSTALGEILPALRTTMVVALLGLVIAMVIGVLSAILMNQAVWVEHALYPYAVVLQTIPILAVVPLIGFWFGFDFPSRLFVCVLVSIFPIITNTLFGLQSVDADLDDLFSLNEATRWQRLVHLELPAALPAMITGFKISAGLSVIGSIIADFFFRQGQPGIGRLIDAYRQRLATEKLLAALLFSSLVGLVLFWIFELIGHRVANRRTSRGG